MWHHDSYSVYCEPLATTENIIFTEIYHIFFMQTSNLNSTTLLTIKFYHIHTYTTLHQMPSHLHTQATTTLQPPCFSVPSVSGKVGLQGSEDMVLRAYIGQRQDNTKWLQIPGSSNVRGPISNNTKISEIVQVRTPRPIPRSLA